MGFDFMGGNKSTKVSSTLNDYRRTATDGSIIAESVNIATADPSVLKSALAANKSITNKFAAALRGTTGQAITAVQALAESRLTDGDTSRNKLVLYTVVAVVLALAAILIFGGKRA